MSTIISIFGQARPSASSQPIDVELLLRTADRYGCEVRADYEPHEPPYYELASPDFLRRISLYYNPADGCWDIKINVLSGQAEWITAGAMAGAAMDKAAARVEIEGKPATRDDVRQLAYQDWAEGQLESGLNTVRALVNSGEAVSIFGVRQPFSFGPNIFARWQRAGESGMVAAFEADMRRMQAADGFALRMKLGGAEGDERSGLVMVLFSGKVPHYSATDADGILFDRDTDGRDTVFIFRQDMWRVFPHEWMMDEYTVALPEGGWARYDEILNRARSYNWDLEEALAEAERRKAEQR